MTTAGKDRLEIGRSIPRFGVVVALSVPLLLSACAGSSDISSSTVFGPDSDKAIVLIGTSVSGAQDKDIKAGRRLETYWQEYNSVTLQLRPEGKSFVTQVSASVFSEPEYLKPTVSVLQVDPGDYALIGAGFPHLMTLYVQTKGNLNRPDSLGNYQSWTYTVDPRRHIDPAADVDPKGNILFSVRPGQIAYIGHFRFEKPQYIDNLVSIGYSQDEAAAREALQDFPGISGEMIALDLRRAEQSVSR